MNHFLVKPPLAPLTFYNKGFSRIPYFKLDEDNFASTSGAQYIWVSYDCGVCHNHGAIFDDVITPNGISKLFPWNLVVYIRQLKSSVSNHRLYFGTSMPKVPVTRDPPETPAFLN